MATVAEKRRDSIALLQREFEPDGIQFLIAGETPTDHDRFFRPAFIAEGSEKLGLGSPWRRHRGRFEIEIFVKRAAHDETGPEICDDYASSIVNLLDGTEQHRVYFRNASQNETGLEGGFWNTRVVLDWYFDSDLAPGVVTAVKFDVEHGIGTFVTDDLFRAILIGTEEDMRYFRERMIGFGPNTTTDPYLYFRLPHDTDRFEVLNNALMTRTPDERWIAHTNPDGTIYVVRGGFGETDVAYLGILMIEPGN